MTRRIRDYKAVVKAAGKADGLGEGQFRALVSTYDVDSYGDRVVPGAFADDVKRWKSGEVLPIVWSHQWQDPFAHIGVGLDAEETDKGLEVLGELQDLEENPTSAQVHRLLKGKRIGQFSFAFDIIDSGWAKSEGEEVYELRNLKTHEVGPCLLGVNQETELLDAKAVALRDAVESGRDLSESTIEHLEKALKSVREVIDLSRLKYAAHEDPEDHSSGSAVESPVAEAKADTTSDRPRLALIDALFVD